MLDRRRFLQGALLAGGLAGVPGWWDRLAAAATPVAADEGILVVVHLGGGNDGLNTLVPMADGTYRDLRGDLAVTDALPLTDWFGFHPALAGLHRRFGDGHVAVVQGVGQTTPDLSHFSATARWMAGDDDGDRSTGWLGRWLDDVPEAEAGLRAVAVGSAVPLHLVGHRSAVTAVDTEGDLPGSDRSDPWNAALYDAIAAMGAGGPTWVDRLGTAGAAAIDRSTRLQPLFDPALPDRGLVSQLDLAARLVNADLGIRVIDVALSGFDTHQAQADRHAPLLAELDAGIERFFGTLAARWHRQVVLMTFSEFGRSPGANASGGTDHGTASTMLVVGDRVVGGLHGQAPDLRRLTATGDLAVTVDYRAAYAAILGGWLAADPVAVLGGEHAGLQLFRGAPGLAAAPVPPRRPVE